MGLKCSFKDALTNEYNLTRHFFEKVADLATGIRAKLIEKTNNPQWSPSKYEDVDCVTSAFTDNPKLFEFHNDRNFDDYPLNYALPSVSVIRQNVLKNRRASKQDIIDHFSQKYEDKMGIKEMVAAVLDEFVVTNNSNELQWRTNNNKQ